MKTVFSIFLAAGLLAAGAPLAGLAAPTPIFYEVRFKDSVVSTQTVTIARGENSTTVTASFAAELPVFVSLQPYSEEVTVTSKKDGTAERFHSIIRDGPRLTEVTGELQDDGRLLIVRPDPEGIVTSQVARADYDFHSLILYGTAPAAFLPTNNPARVLSLADGRVEPVQIQTIAESETTFERQTVSSLHLIWMAGPFVSHSWHPERYGDVPRRYIRQTDHGEFTFILPR